MNSRIHNTLTVIGLAGALLGVVSLAGASHASAQTDPAQCRPGDLLCAEVDVGPIEGRLRIGIGGGEVPPPPPPVVIVEPPPPPPVVYTPPPPPVVVYTPPPAPPPVVYTPPPREPVTIAVETRRTRTTTYELVPTFDMGFHLQLSGMFTDRVSMGGMGGAMRLRPVPHIAIDLGVGIYYGTDYNLAERWEVPLTGDILFFFNPEHRFQIYALIGGGVSYATNGVTRRGSGFIPGREFGYAGGEVGVGAEIRLSRFFAINGDIRGFLRENFAGGAPEFTENVGGLTRSTNTSMGIYGNLGMTFYFFGN